jgi:hypothetical protein
MLAVIISVTAQTNSEQKPVKKSSLIQKEYISKARMRYLMQNSIALNSKCTTTNQFKRNAAKQKLDSVLTFDQFDTESSLTEKVVYKYNQEGYNTSRTDYLSNGVSEELMPNSLEEYDYLNGKTVKLTTSFYKLSDDSFEKEAMSEYIYNQSGLIDSVLTSLWDSESGEWIPFMVNKYTYNSFALVGSVIISIYDGNEIIIYTSEEVYYNDKQQLVKIDIYTYSSMLDIYDTHLELDFDYNNDLLKSVTTSEEDENGEMQFSEQTLYGYDVNNLINSEIDEEYDPDLGSWIEIEKTEIENSSTLTYENTCLPIASTFTTMESPYNYGVMEEEIDYEMVDVWVLNNKNKYYYSDLGTGINEQTANQTWSVYPNPTHDLVYLNSTNTASAKCTILDALGRVVLSQQVSTGQSVDLGSVKAGYYLLQLSDEANNNQVIKIIKQ